jgi:hypothetical protein
MTDYEEKYKAFCIDDRMKRDFSDYSVGVEMLIPLGEKNTETILINDGKIYATHKEDKRA